MIDYGKILSQKVLGIKPSGIRKFFDIANEVNAGDWAAIEDTIHVLALVVVLFCAVTVFLNTIMVWQSLQKK